MSSDKIPMVIHGRMPNGSHRSPSGEEVDIWTLTAKEIIENADEGFSIPTFLEFCSFMK